MASSADLTRSSHTTEVVTALVMGLMAVATFAYQVSLLDEQTTKREALLFNVLEFVFTVGFAWFSSRAVGRTEFEASLKRFAISAYRRIADIERMVGRLHSQVQQYRPLNETESGSSALKVVEAIIGDTAQVVRSSMSDWADVIGDELLSLENLRRLESEKRALVSFPHDVRGKPSTEIEETIAKLDVEIEEARKNLPATLAIQSDDVTQLVVNAQHAASWMSKRHKEEGGLKLNAVTGDAYPNDRPYADLEVGERLFIVDEKDGLNLADAAGNVVARVQNNSPLPYPAFSKAIVQCYDSDRVLCRLIEKLGEDRRDGEDYAWVRIEILRDPQSRRD